MSLAIMASWLTNLLDNASVHNPMPMAGFLDRTPSLGRSDDSGADSTSIPPTPCDKSPAMYGQTYAIPSELDSTMVMSLPLRAATPQPGRLGGLPNIMDPETAASVPLRSLCCIGAGYVGGPTAAVLALHNPHVRVTVVDRDQNRISAWKGKHLPIHEPGLVDVVRAARDGQKEGRRRDESGKKEVVVPARQNNLFFSTDCAKTIAEADMILISVNTPTKLRGQGAGRAIDMTAFEGAVRDVAIHARAGCILVEKSTVPCKTGQLIKNIVSIQMPFRGAIADSNADGGAQAWRRLSSPF